MDLEQIVAQSDEIGDRIDLHFVLTLQESLNLPLLVVAWKHVLEFGSG